MAKIARTIKQEAGNDQWIVYHLVGGKEIVVQRDKIDLRYWHVFDLAKTRRDVDRTVYTGKKPEAIKFARAYIKNL